MYKYGEKGSGFKGEVQDFYKIRENCLLNQILWKDPVFPAINSSLFDNNETPNTDIEWLRPNQIISDPCLIVDGISRFDIKQGNLGSCWLVAAITSLTLQPDLFKFVIPLDQGFKENYCGIFHFRFWVFRNWVDVVIDDRLPTKDKKLIYLNTSDKNEFWGALLEKAYAKIHKSYEAIQGGHPGECLVDFSGGICEIFQLTEEIPSNFFNVIQKSHENGALICTSIYNNSNNSDSVTDQGLGRGYSYIISGVIKFESDLLDCNESFQLIRIRNPWGNYFEWKGPWSEKSPEWQLISDRDKLNLGLTFLTDGEFWISYPDYVKNFNSIEICNIGPFEFNEDGQLYSVKQSWKTSILKGKWVAGITAGGSSKFIETFPSNPQFTITLTEADESNLEGKCTVIIDLMQKDKKNARNKNMANLLCNIGFNIYHLNDPQNVPIPLDKKYFLLNASIERCLFKNARSVNQRFSLSPGTYCIIPSTLQPNEETQFIIRVFSETVNNLKEHDIDVNLSEVDRGVKCADGKCTCTKDDDPTKPVIDVENKNVYDQFYTVADDNDEIDWRTLKTILASSMKTELEDGQCSNEICRNLIAMKDLDHSGTLGIEEFQDLWTDISSWRDVFHLYDVKQEKKINTFQLREALNSAGFKVNIHILVILFHKYASKDGKMTLEDFLLCTARLKTIIDTFKLKIVENNQENSFSLDEWVKKYIY